MPSEDFGNAARIESHFKTSGFFFFAMAYTKRKPVLSRPDFGAFGASVVANPNFTDRDRLCYAILMLCRDRNDRVIITRKAVAELMSCSDSTVGRTYRRLREAGVIGIRKRFACNEITLKA